MVENRAIIERTIFSADAIFAFPSETSGSMNSTPIFLSREMFSWTIGWSYKGSCIAGAIITGIREPMAVAGTFVTGGSSIPDANFSIGLTGAGVARNIFWLP